MYRLADLRRQATSIEQDCPAVVDDALAAVQELIGELKNSIEEVRQAEEQTVYWHSSAERARHECEELLALIPLPFLRTDSRGTILNLNEPAARLLNLSRPHAVGKTFSLFMAADRDSFVTRLAEITASNRIEEWPLHIRPREKQGIRVSATVCASTFHGTAETVTWLLAPVVDRDSGKCSSKRARVKSEQSHR
jgi:PAS domain-containing protein